MKKLFTVFLFGFIATTSVYSQLSTYNFTSVSSTFTALTSPTVLGTTANDEQVFNNNTTGETAPQTDVGFPIGFNFYYNGTFYDKFAVNNNGWILLGTGSFAIGATTLPISLSTTTGFANIISALGRDLQGQSGSSLSYKLIGTAPNRVMVVQWLNYRRYNIASGESFNFQIRLNESDNSVSFVYGTVTTTNSSTTTINNPTQTGLRGAVNSDYKNRTSTTSWSASAGGTLNTNTMFLTTTVRPATGQEYKWTPANMTFSSSTTLSDDTTPIKKYSVNNVIIKVQVVTAGISSPLNATSFTFTTAGSTAASDISNAKVWFTGTGTTFNTSQQFGSVAYNPNGSFTVNGTKTLITGTNYFWLTYDVKGSAVTGHKLDAQCNSLTVVSARIPTAQDPSGFRTITNAPLQGTFNIGLSLFNLVSGKELYYSKSSRMKLHAFLKEGNKDFTKESPGNSESLYNPDQVEYRETPEDVFTLMDGNTPYTGPLCFRLTAEIKSKLPPGTVQADAMGVYANISDAVNDISANGLDGPVEFLLVDEVYNSESFPIELSDLIGSSATNTFTLKPAPGTTPQITMSSGLSLLKIYNSDFVTIDGSNTEGGITKDLSIISNEGFFSYAVWLASESGDIMNNITVKNCFIKTGEMFFGSAPILISDVSGIAGTGYFNNVTISNNIFQKGKTAIYINGGTSTDGISNLLISDNIMNSTGSDAFGYSGIYVQGINNGLITGNEIGNVNSTVSEVDRGIWVAAGSHNLKIEKNKIYNIGYSGTSGFGGHGIYLSPSHTNAFDTVCNNVIYNIFGDGSNYLSAGYLDNPIGIALFSTVPQSGISILNNSINLYGNTLTKAYASSFGIFVSTNSTVSILNNVISNNLGVGSDTAYGSFGIYAQSSNTQFTNIDYNNYYINPTGNGVKIIGKISGTTATTLNSWKSATLQDRSSISYDPGFTSNTNLLPDVNSINTWSLNGRGVQNNSVNKDLNGISRSTTLSGGAPDIGAYEFTPVSLPLSITGTGTFTDGGNQIFIFGSDTVASVTWHGANLPTALTLRYYSGTTPPSPSSGKYGNGYWAFTPTGGAGYTFDVTLYWDPAAIGTINGVSSITIANYTSSVWEHYDATVNITSRKVTKTGLTKLSTFTIDDGNAPLPVSMMYFNNSIDVRNVILKWATSFEINNKGFEIQKNSEFNSEWKKIGFIDGNGTSNIENSYEFKDLNLSTGSYNYRLKQVDYSGSSEYFNLSAAVVIGRPASFFMGQNYPNPSNPKAKIEYHVPFDSKLSIKVFDIQGREVKTLFDAFSPAGYYSIEFDGSDLASGIYFYRIVSENYVKTMKLILVK